MQRRVGDYVGPIQLTTAGSFANVCKWLLKKYSSENDYTYKWIMVSKTAHAFYCQFWVLVFFHLV